MSKTDYISLQELSIKLECEIRFIQSLNSVGLIEIIQIKDVAHVQTLSQQRIACMLRLHRDLNLNVEGIDIVLNLLDRIEVLEMENRYLRNQN